MKNPKFIDLLREPKDRSGRPLWTIAKMAEAIYSDRAHVTQVLNNIPGYGSKTRQKLIRFFKEHFQLWPKILDALSWNERGETLRQSVLPDKPFKGLSEARKGAEGFTYTIPALNHSTWNIAGTLNPWYVTGLAEGEGAFTYSHSGSTVQPKFSLRLRYDYKDLIDAIAVYFGCGRVYFCRARSKSKESSYFVVSARQALPNVVAHFDQFPMQSARKRHAYEVWRQMVTLKLGATRFRQASIGYELSTLAAKLSSLNTRPRGFTEPLRDPSDTTVSTE